MQEKIAIILRVPISRRYFIVKPYLKIWELLCPFTIKCQSFNFIAKSVKNIFSLANIFQFKNFRYFVLFMCVICTMNEQQSSCKLMPHKYFLYIKPPVEKPSGAHSHHTTELDKQLIEMIFIPQNIRTRIQKLQNTVNVLLYWIKIANNPPAEKGCSHKVMIAK